MLALEKNWIETTAYRDRNQTGWVVKLDGEIVKAGEVRDDPSGLNAYEAASAWAAQNLPGHDFHWKHWNGVSDTETK